ncbi:MAG: peroxiredoxin family protein [Candidatus Eisenbacteria bacterium]
MRLLSSVLAILICACTCLAFSPDPGQAEETSASKAPDFTAKNLQGEAVSLSEALKKGPVLIDFWTTWCKPCQIELPELDRLHREFQDKGFQVFAIAQDDPKTIAKVKPLVDQKDWKMTVLVDPERKVGNAFHVRNYPTSFLIAQDGTIVHNAQGYMRGDEKVLEEKVRGLLGMGGGTEHTNSGADK